MEEQNARLEHIEEGLQCSQSASPSTSAGPSRCHRWYITFTISCIFAFMSYIGDNVWDRLGRLL